MLTRNYGFITDYLAEVFHYLSKKVNRYEYVNRTCRFGRALQGRDEVLSSSSDKERAYPLPLRA